MVEKYVLGDMRFYPCILLVDNSPNALDWWSLPREWRRPDFLFVWDNVASGYGNWFIIFNEDIRKIVAQYSSFFIFTFYVTYRSCVYENCIVPMEGTLQNRTSRIVYTNIIIRCLSHSFSLELADEVLDGRRCSRPCGTPCRDGWGPMWRKMTTASVGAVGFNFATLFVSFSLKFQSRYLNFANCSLFYLLGRHNSRKVVRITFNRLTKRHGGLTVGFVVVDDGSTSYLVSWYKAQHYQGIVLKKSNFSVFGT